MTRTTSSLRVVESAEEAAKSPELHGLRKLSDGSIEYQVAVKKGEHRWRFLCSPITVVALTRNADSQNWGRLLEIADADGHCHRWIMPASMLARIRGEEIRQALFSYGARISPGRSAAAALHRYLMAETRLQREKAAKGEEKHYAPAGTTEFLCFPRLLSEDLRRSPIKSVSNSGCHPQTRYAQGVAVICGRPGRCQHSPDARVVRVVRSATLTAPANGRRLHSFSRRIIRWKDNRASRCRQRMGRTLRTRRTEQLQTNLAERPPTVLRA